MVISPFAKKNFVDHTLVDQSSVLRFIEDNWLGGERIQPGGSFDTIAGSIQNMSQSGSEGRAREGARLGSAPARAMIDRRRLLVLDGALGLVAGRRNGRAELDPHARRRHLRMAPGCRAGDGRAHRTPAAAASGRARALRRPAADPARAQAGRDCGPTRTARAQRFRYYRVAMREAAVAVHRDVPPTRVWSYAGSVPGPTFETRSGQRPARRVGQRASGAALPADRPHPLRGGRRPARGAHRRPRARREVPSESDGYPEDWYTPGSLGDLPLPEPRRTPRRSGTTTTRWASSG